MMLDREQATYEREREALKQTGAKWVLIKGDDVIATFPTFADGMEAGYERFGTELFMVNAVQDEDYYRFVPYAVVAEVELN